jgi:signal transduction histidine kinase
LYGDDPSHENRRAVFSAAPIRIDGRIAGYLYVVMGSERYESVVAAVRGNYSLQLGLISAAGVMSAVFILGVALFFRLTLPLRQLAKRMREWAAAAGVAPDVPAAPDTMDDIALLGNQFERMARRIEHQLQEIKSRDAQRRELIANVSHDLRTPLTSLRGYVETVLMKGDALPAAARREYLEVACRHARQLETRVAALLELSKLESGAIVPNVQPFSLGELLQDVALRFRLRAQQLGVEIVARIDPSAPQVSGDIGLIERILENLLDNALRHTGTGGRVSLEMRHDGGHAVVTVNDTGRGIPMADLPRVFDRFYSSTPRREGAGLGLAIVRRIVELHGESVSLHSTPGIGTSVEFGLPLAGSSAALPAPDQPATAASSGSSLSA